MTAGDPRCATWDDVADWWAGDLDPSREEALEEHLLACGACALRAERMRALARGVAALMRGGAVPGAATPGLVRRLERDGVRVHRYRIRPGEVVPCSVWPDDDVLATVLDVPATGDPEPRFDLVARFGDEPALRVEDVPVDRASGTLTWLTPAAAERPRPATRIAFQVLRVHGRAEAVAAEYALAHEPWSGPSSPR